MKKLFTLSLAALMLVASLAFVAQPAQAQGPGLVSSILNKMDRNRRSLASLRSAVTMWKFNAQLGGRPEEYRGDVAYIAGKGRDANVRVDWTKPVRESLSVMGGQYTLYRPRLGQAIKGSARNSKDAKVNNVMSFAFNMTGAQAKSQFNVDFVGEGELYPGSPHVLWLKLTPRGGASYQFAEVWVTDDGMPIQARVTEKNNDSTTIRLTNVQRNARVSSDEIEIKLPEGTKIVKG